MRKFDWWSEFERGEDSYNSNSAREFRYDRQCVIIQSKVQASIKKKVYDVTVGILCRIFSFFKYFFIKIIIICKLGETICVTSHSCSNNTSAHSLILVCEFGSYYCITVPEHHPLTHPI